MSNKISRDLKLNKKINHVSLIFLDNLFHMVILL